MKPTDINITSLFSAMVVAEEIERNPRGAHARAAARLELAPASLSGRLREIETGLGLALFEGKQRNRLTSAGEALLSCGPMLHRCCEAVIETLQLAGDD